MGSDATDPPSAGSKLGSSGNSFHLRLPLEVLELQELRLCRPRRQDPGRRSVKGDDLAQRSAMREGLEPTHWSSGHHGVLPSVALNIQKGESNRSFTSGADLLCDRLQACVYFCFKSI